MRITFSTLAISVSETFTFKTGHNLNIRATLDRSTFPESWESVSRYIKGTDPLDLVCTAMGSSLIIQKPDPLKLLVIDCKSVNKRLELQTCDYESVVLDLSYLTQSNYGIEELAETRSKCWSRLIRSVCYGSVVMNYKRPYISLVPANNELVWEKVVLVKE